MIRKSALFALAALSLQAAWAASPAALPAARLDAAAPARYLEHVKTLAAPEMRGRGAGMPELEQAGDYIVEQFRAIGLEPGGLDGEFKQPFIVTTGAKMGDRNRLVARNVAGEQAVEVGQGQALGAVAHGSHQGQAVGAALDGEAAGPVIEGEGRAAAVGVRGGQVGPAVAVEIARPDALGGPFEGHGRIERKAAEAIIVQRQERVAVAGTRLRGHGEIQVAVVVEEIGRASCRERV